MMVDSIISFPLQNFTKFVSVFSSIQQTQAVMVYHINHDEVEMNNIPILTVEPVAELLRANGEICFPSSRENTASILSHSAWNVSIFGLHWLLEYCFSFE